MNDPVHVNCEPGAYCPSRRISRGRNILTVYARDAFVIPAKKRRTVMVGFTVNYCGEVLVKTISENVGAVFGKIRAGEPVSITLRNDGDVDYTVELGAKIADILLEEISSE